MAINPLDPEYISPTEGAAQSPSLIPKDKGGQQASPTPSPTNNSRDAVNFSDEQQEYQSLLDAVRDVPDIRQEKIRKIQKALESGEYRVASEEIADRIIQDTVINNPQKPN